MTDATQASELMMRFAERTGVTSERPGRRYLWTDAFAVCNFLALGQRDLAIRVVERVHATLARHRDRERDGTWLAPADAEHPTRGGLRIGKPLPERGIDERFSEQLEWERDGQYFHYLTKWMHALDVLARSTGRADVARWARELAITAHRAFTYDSGGAKRMYWKMSVDLSRPLVASMGHHDPLDGLITAIQLDEVPATLVTDFASMLDLPHLATSDPLGLGGLLVDACRVYQLIEQRTWLVDLDLLEPLLDAALVGLRHFVRSHDLDGSPERRLAFRELGLAIGLAGLEIMQGGDVPRTVSAKLAALADYLPVRTAIVELWRRPEPRRGRIWLEHEDINDVMLATSLAPRGFLVLPRPRARSGARTAVAT